MSHPKQLGRYEIQEVLGRGGMGVVYRAYDSVIRREVALKTIRDSPSSTALQLFRKECEILASMSHPNIVEIFDIGELTEEGETKPYFVMPFLQGVPLDKLINSKSQRLTVERSVEILCQLSRGLQAAHERGLVHRDLKPSNVFVMEDDSVKVIDFGVAHMVDTASSVGRKGTVMYMSPEQIEMKSITALSDIFSLGVLSYETLTRRWPFESAAQTEIAQGILRQIPPPVSDINPAVNQTISRVVHKAMAKQPYHRFSSAKEFAEALQKAVRNETIEIFDPSRIQPRVQRAAKAYEQADYQFASEILSELEAEGHIDPGIPLLRRQIDAAMRKKTIHQLLESARTRFEEDEHPLALQKIQEALQLDPDNRDALVLKSTIEGKRTTKKIDDWLRLARQHIDNFDFSHARSALQNVLQISSRDSRALGMVAEVDRKEQDYLKVREEKQKLYRAALDAWEGGDASAAMSKMELVLDLDRRAPDSAAPERGTTYQNFYNQVRSEHDAIRNAYGEARKQLAERNFVRALEICEELLGKHPGHALFQALKIDVEEMQRQELSASIAEINRRVDAEPDLERRVNILEEAIEHFPGEPHFEKLLRGAREKRDLSASIVAKARLHEERSQFAEALGQWEILQTIYSSYPGLAFELERLRTRRDQQMRAGAKARWVEQVDRQLEVGDPQRALELVESAQKEFPGDTELGGLEKLSRQGLERGVEAQRLLEQGQEQCAAGNYDEGFASLRRAAELDSRNPVIRGVLLATQVERAQALLDTDWRAADDLMRQALDLDPDYAPARSVQTLARDRELEEFVGTCLTQARHLQADNNLDGALAEVQRGLRTCPRDARLLQLRATLQRAVEEAPMSSTARFFGITPGEAPTEAVLRSEGGIPSAPAPPSQARPTGASQGGTSPPAGPPPRPAAPGESAPLLPETLVTSGQSMDVEKFVREQARFNDVEELKRLSQQFREATDLKDKKALLEQAQAIVARHPDDPQFQRAGTGLQQSLAQVARELDAPSSESSSAHRPASEFALTEPAAPPVAPTPPTAATPPTPPAEPKSAEEMLAELLDARAIPKPSPSVTSSALPTPTGPAGPAQPRSAPPKQPVLRKGPIVAMAAGTLVIAVIVSAYLLWPRGTKPVAKGGAVTVPFAIRTTPPGARILLNDSARGVSNLNLNLPEGEYRLTVERPGYQTVTTTVKAAPNSPGTFDVALEPLPLVVRLYSDLESGKIFIDDQPGGDLQDGQVVLNNVPPGKHTLRVSGPQGEASLSFEAAPASAPVITGPISARNVQAVAIGNMGGEAKLHAGTAGSKVAVDGGGVVDVPNGGLSLTALPTGSHQLALEAGAEKKQVSIDLGPNPALTLFLGSNREIGTLVVATGESDVAVFLNDRQQRTLTKNGRMRIPNLPLREYTIRVHKEGFFDEPARRVAVKKGEDLLVEFRLQKRPTVATLQFQGAPAGAQVLVEGSAAGTVGADGSLTVTNVAPGEHIIDLRKDGFRPKRIRKTFRAGETVTVTAAEAALEGATGGIRVAVTPAGTTLTLTAAGRSEIRSIGEEVTGLPEGVYTVTGRAAGHIEKSVTVRVGPGETRTVELQLVRERPVVRAGTMSDWGPTAKWAREGDWFVHKGGNFVLYGRTPTTGKFEFAVMQRSGGAFRRRNPLQWVLNYKDDRNYLLMQIEDKNFTRLRVVNGNRTRATTVPHGMQGNSYTLRIGITAGGVSHSRYESGRWVVIDAWGDSGVNPGEGQFGFLIPGSDVVWISNFRFDPEQ